MQTLSHTMDPVQIMKVICDRLSFDVYENILVQEAIDKLEKLQTNEQKHSDTMTDLNNLRDALEEIRSITENTL